MSGYLDAIIDLGLKTDRVTDNTPILQPYLLSFFTLLLMMLPIFSYGSSRTFELNQCGTADPSDDAIPNDGIDDQACFQNALSMAGNDSEAHVLSGEWDLKAGGQLFRTGVSNFTFRGDGPSSKLKMGSNTTLLFAGISEGYIGDFQIYKDPTSLAIDHILLVESTLRVNVNNIEIYANCIAAGLKIYDNYGMGISNGNLVQNIRVVNSKGLSAATKGITILADFPGAGSFDNRFLNIIAPNTGCGPGSGESALYENGNSGGVWDIIDINPPTDMILLDIIGASRQIYQRFLTAPGENTVPLVKIQDSSALTIDDWQIPGNGTISRNHIFQALPGITGVGCEGCSFSNIIFDKKNMSDGIPGGDGPDYFNFAASPTVEVINNIWRLSDNADGSSIVEAASGANQLLIRANIKQSGAESDDIKIVADALGIIIEGNIGFGITGAYQSAIDPFIINSPESGVINSAAVQSYSGSSLAGIMSRDKTNDVETYHGPADGNKGIAGTMSFHPYHIRTSNTARIMITSDGKILLNGGLSVGQSGKRALCIDPVSFELFISPTRTCGP